MKVFSYSMCCAPYDVAMGNDHRYIDKYFKEAVIPYCRLHDCCGGWGGTHFVDVPNIFPDFDADENDANNYDFHYSDERIGFFAFDIITVFCYFCTLRNHRRKMSCSCICFFLF